MNVTIKIYHFCFHLTTVLNLNVIHMPPRLFDLNYDVATIISRGRVLSGAPKHLDYTIRSYVESCRKGSIEAPGSGCRNFVCSRTRPNTQMRHCAQGVTI